MTRFLVPCHRTNELIDLLEKCPSCPSYNDCYDLGSEAAAYEHMEYSDMFPEEGDQ